MPDLLVAIVAYVIYTLPLFIIALKSQHNLALLAWIPFANIWLVCDMADLELWWILIAILVPYVGVLIFWVVAWGRLAENTNKPSWLGVLMVIPIVCIFVGYYIAMANT